jgi:L-ascorbate metabolism protein UlaG (beta-lactamase superfamily)
VRFAGQIGSPMRLQWVGQCCFFLQAADGRSLLFDPFQRVIGLDRGDFAADVVLFSHSHIDHCDPSAVPAGAMTVTGPGHHEAAGFRIFGVQAFHDPHEGLLSGEVTIFSVEVDGYRVVHLSDLGEQLDDTRIAALARPDVLLFPAGEHTTLSLAESAALVQRLAPKIAIPMAAHLPGLLMPSAQGAKVEKTFPRHRRASVLDLAPGTRLDPRTEVRILDAIPYPLPSAQPVMAGGPAPEAYKLA